MRRVIGIFFLVCVFISSKAQFTFSYNQLKEKYNRFNSVILEKSEEVIIDIVKDSLVASQRHKEQVLILSENSTIFSNDRILVSSFTSVRDVDAKTYIPYKNGKYKSLKVVDYKSVDDISEYVFYDDSKAILLTYPALQEGAVTSLEYTTDYKDTRFLRTFIFRSYLPVLKTALLIKVNKNIELEFREFHTKDFPYTYSETEDANYKYYRWETAELEAYKSGGDKISILHYSPHIVYYIARVHINGSVNKQYGTINDLYHYYFQMIKDVDTSCHIDIKEKVKEIIKGKVNEDERVEAVLKWVRENIKYIAFEQEMRGFIPNHGYEVYGKKYGDCKDMSTLIVTMLNCAGIRSHLAWTGTRHIPYSFEDLPLPKTTNHMVAVYLKNDMPVILDGTIRYLAYGYPPYLLQGKEIMVSFDEEQYKIFKVPVLSPEENIKISEYSLFPANNMITGNGNVSFHGYHCSELLYNLSGENAQQQKNIMSGIFSVGNNKFKLEDYRQMNLGKEEEEITYYFKFSVPAYIKSIEDEMYVNLNLDKSYLNLQMDTSFNELPIENDYCFTEKYITKLDIPDGYIIENIPVNRSIKNEHCGFEISYYTKQDTIVQEKMVYFNFLEIDKKYLNEWNTFITELVEAYRETLVLKRMD